MSSTNAESESKEEVQQRSGEEEDERTENGYSQYEELHGSMMMAENGTAASSSWRASGMRAGKSDPAQLLSLAFPISRVRRLVKSEGDIQWVGVEAGFLIAKATEIFLEKMVEDEFGRMQDNPQESILYPHLASHVAISERLEFLSDFVPMKIPASTGSSMAQTRPSA